MIGCDDIHVELPIVSMRATQKSSVSIMKVISKTGAQAKRAVHILPLARLEVEPWTI